jgi:TP901 family phage tail tape measure protein
VASEIGTGYIKVLYETSGLSEAGSGITGKLLPLMGKYGKLAGAGLAVGVAAGVGKALYDVGETLEVAHNRLRTQTGKTGEALAKLDDEAHQVAEHVPVSFNDAADAMAGVTNKLHLAGPPAEHLAEQMSKLSRITGTTTKDNITAVTGVLGRWNLSADKAQGITNLLFRASEETGTSFADVAGTTAKSANIMKSYGYGIGDTASIMAKLSEKGFTATKITMGLNTGLANMAKEGKNPTEMFPKLIQRIKDAHNPTTALGIAVKNFGTRAGTELTGAIRQGVFSTDKITKTIKSGSDTVSKASDSTLTLSDRWKMFKNTLAVIVAPAAEALVKLLNEGMAWALKELPPLIQWVGDTIHQVWPNMGHDVANVMAQIQDAIQQTVHVIRVIWNSWFGHLMKDIVARNLRAILTTVKAAFKLIGDVFHTIGDLLHGRWGKLWGDLKTIVMDQLNLIIDYIKSYPIVNLILTLADKAFQAAKRLGKSIYNGVVGGLSGLAGAVGGAVKSALNSAIGFMNSGLGKIAGILNHVPGFHMPSGGIPLLAGGGVINTPTLAFVGESASSRPEIVTPERLLRRIMREEGGGGGGRHALTITNWHEGTGYISRISDESVAGAGRLARQRARMAR